MSYANLGWLFYKDYFKGLNFENLESSQNLIKSKIDELLNEQITPNSTTLGNKHFKATTTYPGLLVGSGYLHQLSVEEELIIGFDFDYTTGLPIIRGSSVKGVLRSAFENPEYIQEILKKGNVNIKSLELEIFGQENSNNDKISGKDVFFDAEIISSGKILADDYITPHKEITKNPIPLRFIKVAPNVTFRFDFLLTDGLISKDEKLELFKTILGDLGVGAKTNVGYGKFYIPVTKSDNPIENYKKPSQELFKKLKELNLSDEKKKEYLKIFQKRFENEDKNGKWIKKITNLLMN